MNNKRRLYLKKQLDKLLEAKADVLHAWEYGPGDSYEAKKDAFKKLKEEFIKDMLDQ